MASFGGTKAPVFTHHFGFNRAGGEGGERLQVARQSAVRSTKHQELQARGGREGWGLGTHLVQPSHSNENRKRPNREVKT